MISREIDPEKIGASLHQQDQVKGVVINEGLVLERLLSQQLEDTVQQIDENKETRRNEEILLSARLSREINKELQRKESLKTKLELLQRKSLEDISLKSTSKNLENRVLLDNINLTTKPTKRSESESILNQELTPKLLRVVREIKKTKQHKEGPDHRKKNGRKNKTETSRSPNSKKDIPGQFSKTMNEVGNLDTKNSPGNINASTEREQFGDVARILEDIKRNVFDGLSGITSLKANAQSSKDDTHFKGFESKERFLVGSPELPRTPQMESFSQKLREVIREKPLSMRANCTSEGLDEEVQAKVMTINQKIQLLEKMNEESELDLQQELEKQRSSLIQVSHKRTEKTLPPIKPRRGSHQHRKRKSTNEVKVGKNEIPDKSVGCPEREPQEEARTGVFARQQLEHKPTLQTSPSNIKDLGNYKSKQEIIFTKGAISDDSKKIFQVSEESHSDNSKMKAKVLSVAKNPPKENPKSVQEKVKPKKSSSSRSSRNPHKKRKPPLPIFRAGKIKTNSLKRMVKRSINNDKNEYWKNRSLSSYRLKYKNDDHKIMKKRYFLQNKKNMTFESIHIGDKKGLGLVVQNMPRPNKDLDQLISEPGVDHKSQNMLRASVGIHIQLPISRIDHI